MVSAWEAYRVDESAEINEYGIESYDTHGLEWIAINDIARNYCVANLDTGRD